MYVYRSTLRRVHVVISAVEKQYYIFQYVCARVRGFVVALACACSLTYAECKAHATYYIFISGLSGSTKSATLSH